jgi:hypothetical protein
MGFGSWNRKKLFRILDLEIYLYINVNESRETRKRYFKLEKVTNVSYKKIIKAF